MSIDDVNEFWFGTDEQACRIAMQRWWRKDPVLDAQIAEQFGDLMTRAAAGDLDNWKQTATGCLALIVLLDQFPRNVHRDSGQAWAADADAQRVSLHLIETQMLQQLPIWRRLMAVMPLMHAEDRQLQLVSIAQNEKLVAAAPDSWRSTAEGQLKYAHMHKDIVDRFGRYPHRNERLGRATTDDEAEFLAGPNSSF